MVGLQHFALDAELIAAAPVAASAIIDAGPDDAAGNRHAPSTINLIVIAGVPTARHQPGKNGWRRASSR